MSSEPVSYIIKPTLFEGEVHLKDPATQFFNITIYQLERENAYLLNQISEKSELLRTILGQNTIKPRNPIAMSLKSTIKEKNTVKTYHQKIQYLYNKVDPDTLRRMSQRIEVMKKKVKTLEKSNENLNRKFRIDKNRGDIPHDDLGQLLKNRLFLLEKLEKVEKDNEETIKSIGTHKNLRKELRNKFLKMKKSLVLDRSEENINLEALRRRNQANKANASRALSLKNRKLQLMKQLGILKIEEEDLYVKHSTLDKQLEIMQTELDKLQKATEGSPIEKIVKKVTKTKQRKKLLSKFSLTIPRPENQDKLSTRTDDPYSYLLNISN